MYFLSPAKSLSVLLMRSNKSQQFCHPFCHPKNKKPLIIGVFVTFKRSRADSNRCRSFCRAQPSHSATGPFCFFIGIAKINKFYLSDVFFSVLTEYCAKQTEHKQLSNSFLSCSSVFFSTNKPSHQQPLASYPHKKGAPHFEHFFTGIRQKSGCLLFPHCHSLED